MPDRKNINDAEIQLNAELPAEFVYYNADREVTIYIEKVGGGTMGQKYSGMWRYVATDNEGYILHEGDDFGTGMPATHHEAARQLSDLLFHNED